PFEIPGDIYAGYDARDAGKKREAEWNALFDTYAEAHPELAAELKRRIDGKLPDDWAKVTGDFIASTQKEGPEVASRKASQMVLDAYGPHLPELIGGSADLAGSNLTIWKGSHNIVDGGPDANYIHYGVREFGMTAINTGLALHGGLVPYDATFLVFSDYARNAVRMSCLIPAPAIHVYTHDSIGLGEDGPTHQPVEHLASLRLIPGLSVWRPADKVETAAAWAAAIARRDKPTALVLTRQGLPHQPRSSAQLDLIRRGGYVLAEPADGPIDVLIMASGSEVGLAVEAAASLAEEGVGARVV